MLIDTPPVAVTENLWMLGTRAYPLYLYRTDGEAILFEGSVGAMARLVAEQIDGMGIDRASVRQLVITHAHPDHVMAVPRLRAIFPDLAVLASETAARTLASEKAVGFFAQIDEMITGSLVAREIIGAEQRPEPFAEKGIAVDRTIAEGDLVTVGPASFEVLQTPGHSDCSLSFFEPREAILIVSDATGYYMPEHGTWWPNYFTNYGDYLHSIQRLAGFQADVLCLSHNGAIRGREAVQAYFDEVLAATKAYHQRIVGEIKAGKPSRQLGEELGAEIHAKTPVLPLDFFQKNCSLLVKLSMKHEGLAGEAR